MTLSGQRLTVGTPTSSLPGVGEILKSARAAAGLSLREVAARAGYSHAYVHAVETGITPGSHEAVHAIAAACGIRISVNVTVEEVVS